MTEIGEGFFEKKTTRRGFLQGIKRALIGLGVVGAGAGVGEIIRRQESRPESKIGQPIGNELKRFVTGELPDEKGIPVRKRPTLADNDIIGYTVSGIKLQGKEVYGYRYPSAFIGPVTEPETKQEYFPWFKAERIPLYRKLDGENLVPMSDENGNQIFAAGFISENFLKAVESEQGQKESPNP